MLVVTYISLFLVSVLCIVAYIKLRISKDEKTQNPTFIPFQRKYIIVYLLVLLGDWLQGPYLYRLYHYYGFQETQVAVIYVCGLISSAVFFPAKGFIADKFGRRRAIVVMCVMYSISCLLTLSHNYGVLLLGRCVSGLTNTLLFSVLDAWYIHEHVLNFDFPEEWIKITFSHIAFGSSLVAMVSGFFADLFARWFHFGPVAPFLLAAVVFLASVAGVTVLFNENYGEEAKQVTRKQMVKSCSQGLKAIVQNLDLFLVGAITSLFESVLFIFVFIWTPALDVYHDVPLGIAFASFMVCFMLGNIVCDFLIAKVGYSMTRLLIFISGAAACVFVVAAFFARHNSGTFYRIQILICLQLFELICGFYFPIMRVLREKVLPEAHRVSIQNWFRVPLTVLSALALLLLHDASGGIPEIFMFCAFMMALACLCSLRFAKVTSAASDEGSENGTFA